jgi:hypothetical protein
MENDGLREAMEAIARKRDPTRQYPESVADEFHDASQSTPVVCAVYRGNKEALEILLGYGADVNCDVGSLSPGWREMDFSPLLYALFQISTVAGDSQAMKKEREEMVFLLIEAGADVTRISKEKGLALPMATSAFFPPKKWEFRMKLLSAVLTKGAKPSVCHMPGLIPSPLSSACMKGFFGSEDNRIHVIQLLLKQGADPGVLTSPVAGLSYTSLH